VARISWDLYVLVLDDVLFNESLATGSSFALLDGSLIDVDSRKVSTVAGDVLCHFVSADCQLVKSVCLLCRFIVQDAARVMAELSHGLLELSLISATA